MPMSLREPPSSWTAMFQGWLEHFLGRSITRYGWTLRVVRPLRVVERGRGLAPRQPQTEML